MPVLPAFSWLNRAFLKESQMNRKVPPEIFRKSEGDSFMKLSKPQVLSGHLLQGPTIRLVQNNRISVRTQSRAFSSILVGFVMVATVGTAQATFPGRNGLIAFQAQTDAGVQIFTVRHNGQELRQITHVSGDAAAPDWSPDGRRIVFEHDPADACANVAIMNADGTDIIEFPDPNVCQDDPSFTPDGSRIVFHRFDPATNDEAFWTMDLNGNDRQRIIGSCCFDPNVSPGGEKLSFVAENGQPVGAALFTSDLDGSNVVQVTPFDFNVAVKQDWSPDGKRLVFSKDGNV